MKTVPTFTATIWVGTREQYTPTIRSIDMAKAWLHTYVNEVGLCVTMIPTEFIYTGKDGPSGKTNAGEPGFAVGLINYPRFPVEYNKFCGQAIDIAKGLMSLYKQFKVTIVLPTETIMLEEEDIDKT